MITKKEIFKALTILSFFPTIFGFMVMKSGFRKLDMIPHLIPVKVKIDSVTSSTTGGGKPNVSGHFTYNNEYHRISYSSDGASYQRYIGKDSIDIWLNYGDKGTFLKEINPTKEVLYNRYNKITFLLGGGMIYPFLIFLFLYLRQVHLDKKKNKTH